MLELLQGLTGLKLAMLDPSPRALHGSTLTRLLFGTMTLAHIEGW